MSDTDSYGDMYAEDKPVHRDTLRYIDARAKEYRYQIEQRDEKIAALAAEFGERSPYHSLGLDTMPDENEDIFDSLEGAKFDGDKVRLDLIPPEATWSLGQVLTMGARKYDARNWEKGFNWGRSVAALERHLTAWKGGEDTDPESGFSHLAHVLCNAAFLVTFEARGVGTDDRPAACRLDRLMYGSRSQEDSE